MKGDIERHRLFVPGAVAWLDSANGLRLLSAKDYHRPRGLESGKSELATYSTSGEQGFSVDFIQAMQWMVCDGEPCVEVSGHLLLICDW